MLNKLCFAYNVMTSTILAILLIAVHYGVIDLPASEPVQQQVNYNADGFNKLLDSHLNKLAQKGK